MSKFKFIKNREKLSDQEIESTMNFDQFMKGYQASGKSWMKAGKVKFFSGLAAIAVVVSLGVFFSENIFSVNETSPFINPPLPESKIASGNYTIDPLKDTIIIYKTGSSIYVPATSFVDGMGNEVKGKVEIRYREFHNPFDIFLSGIPMRYDSAGVVYQLETGGMIECLAFQDNRPLGIKPGKSLTVNMVSHTSENNYNIYYLDSTKRNWEFIQQNSIENRTNLPLFSWNAMKTYEAEVNFNVEPAIPSVAKNDAANIELDYKKEDFPELAVFDGVKFEVDPNDKNFDPSLSEKTWDDVFIKKDNNKKYVMTFIKENETHDFIVMPVLGEKDFERAQKDYVKKHQEYITLLEKKQKDEAYREDVIRMNYDKLTNVAQWSNVNKWVNEFIDQDHVNYMELASRTFNVTRLGVWNCDRPTTQSLEEVARGKIPATEAIEKRKAYFTDTKNNVLELKALYLIPDSQATVYAFPASGNSAKLAFIKTAKYSIIAVTKDGLPAYLNAEQFAKSASNEGDLSLSFNVSDVKFRNPEALREFVKMQ